MHADGAPFIFFAVMTAIQFVVVLFGYPETKGQTLEQLQRKLMPQIKLTSPSLPAPPPPLLAWLNFLFLKVEGHPCGITTFLISFLCCVSLTGFLGPADSLGVRLLFAGASLHFQQTGYFQWPAGAMAGRRAGQPIQSRIILLPEKESAELDRIGQKLSRQLPPTPIRFHFRVYESEEANAFSVAGGYVYVSRKLITDAHNEDEIAGVVAHEIGHIYTHQLAIEYTHHFKVRMNLTSLGGQEDVDDKLQQLLNIHRKPNEEFSEDQEDKDEFMADRVGMFAMTRAGYTPRAFAEVLDRISANKGRLGSFLTDMLEINSIETRRVRAARALANELPAECKKQAEGASPEFKEFQQKIRSAPVNWIVDPTQGLKSFKLDSPMRPALDQVRFSPNGQYLLAQDETSIHVLSRSPLKLLFSSMRRVPRMRTLRRIRGRLSSTTRLCA